MIPATTRRATGVSTGDVDLIETEKDVLTVSISAL